MPPPLRPPCCPRGKRRAPSDEGSWSVVATNSSWRAFLLECRQGAIGQPTVADHSGQWNNNPEYLRTALSLPKTHRSGNQATSRT